MSAKLTIAQNAGIQRACSNIQDLAAEISAAAKQGDSPYDENGKAGLWLRSLREQLTNLEIAAQN